MTQCLSGKQGRRACGVVMMVGPLREQHVLPLTQGFLGPSRLNHDIMVLTKLVADPCLSRRAALGFAQCDGRCESNEILFGQRGGFGPGH
jgi:hypothetical protein